MFPWLIVETVNGLLIIVRWLSRWSLISRLDLWHLFIAHYPLCAIVIAFSNAPFARLLVISREAHDSLFIFSGAPGYTMRCENIREWIWISSKIGIRQSSALYYIQISRALNNTTVKTSWRHSWTVPMYDRVFDAGKYNTFFVCYILYLDTGATPFSVILVVRQAVCVKYCSACPQVFHRRLMKFHIGALIGNVMLATHIFLELTLPPALNNKPVA